MKNGSIKDRQDIFLLLSSFCVLSIAACYVHRYPYFVLFYLFICLFFGGGYCQWFLYNLLIWPVGDCVHCDMQWSVFLLE